MSRLTTYHYAVMTKAKADEHVSETVYGLRYSNDGDTVIAKLPSTITISGATMLGISQLQQYITENTDNWSDPST